MSRIRLAGFSTAAVGLLLGLSMQAQTVSVSERSVRASPGANPVPKSTAQVGVSVTTALRQDSRNGRKPQVRRNAGPGWTFAQVKRMARKRRNVQRNRRAHR